MMKNRFILIILACVFAVSFVLGATGAVTFAKEETQSTENSGKDRLIGVLITTEYLDLFDFESYIHDNAELLLSGGEINRSGSDPYQEKLYAALVDDPYSNPETGETTTTKKYVFKGVEGICYFAARYSDKDGIYWGIGGDEAISDGHTGIKSTDAGDSIDLKGTIYVSTSKGPDAFYYNPVYQTPGGEVYAMTGAGMSYGGDFVAGMGGSHALKDEQTVTVNGKSETVSTNVEVSTCYMDTPTGTSILQFGNDGEIISEKKFASGNLPSKITTEPDAAYMIVETHMKSADGTQAVARELFQPEAESLFAFSCREDGICIKQYCSIVWDQNKQGNG